MATLSGDPVLAPSSDLKALSASEVLARLRSGEGGLTGDEARRRLEVYGPNAIEEKRRNPILDFLRRFWGPMPWLLELAMVLSFVIRHPLEGEIIAALLTVNATIGFLHQRGSQKAVEMLKARLAIKARVLRDGRWVVVDAPALVPGDVLTVKLGDVVAADAKILDGELSLDQSALTGESLPVEAGPADLLYAGSIVRRGEARAVVVNTGARTYFGRTAELVKVARPASHQEEVMVAIVRDMMYLGIAASVLVALHALALHAGLVSILTFVVTFLMGAVPVALPAVLAITEAATAMELSKDGVLVTRLASIEDAASVSVLCLDKTGTITENRLAVAEVVPAAGFSADEVSRIAAAASRADGMDLIDLAVLAHAKSVPGDAARQVSYVPFSPATRRTEGVVESAEGRWKAVKGAAQVLLPLCAATPEAERAAVEARIEEFSKKGHRALAVARTDGGEDGPLRFAGLLALADPPRADSAGMIAALRAMGVKPMMLTGDALPIAREIAQRVGIGPAIVRLHDLDGLSEEEQARAAEQADGFAEIYPEDKYKIVRLLQSRGARVGMTGDGVNDAPALKQAEMGVAVSNAADVAKAAASIVLTEPGLAVIEEAIERSRQTYQRMLTWVINKVTKTVQAVGLLTIGYFMTGQMVLSLLGMSLLVFANDFVTMSLATDNARAADRPNHWAVRNITAASLIVGGLLVAEGIAALVAGQRVFHLDLPRLRSFMLLTLVFTSEFRVLVVRERRWFWSSAPSKTLLVSTMAGVAVFIVLGARGIFIAALTPAQIAALLAFSAAFTLALDAPKVWAFRRFGV